MKLYFDTNLISYLQDPRSYEGQSWHPLLKSIQDFSFALPDESSILYSPAHLTDIRQGHIKNEAKSLKKLAFVGKLTKNQCIVKYAYYDEVRYETRDPTEFFLTNPDNDQGFFLNNGEKINLLSLVESSGIYDRYKAMPINYTAAEPVLSLLGIDLHRTKVNPTAYSLLLDFAEFLPDIISEGHVFYKAMKEKAKRETGMSNKFGSTSDPIGFLTSLLPQTDFGKQFQDIMNESFEQDNNNRRDRISHLYMDLDLLGYKSDKVTESHG